MKTIGQLMDNTPSDIIQRSHETSVSILHIDQVKKRDLDAIVFSGKGRAKTDKEAYALVIELYPIEVHQNVYTKIGTDTPAWVHCTCPFFKYNLEYVLARAGSSEFRSLEAGFRNVKPKVTNPKMIPYLCKHLYAAAPIVLRKSQGLSKSAKGAKFVK